MSVTTTRPINLGQLSAEVGAGLAMDDRGDQRVISCPDASVNDPALTAAVNAHTPDPTFGKAAEDQNLAGLRAKAQAVFAGTDTFTPTQLQKIVAGLVLRATR